MKQMNLAKAKQISDLYLKIKKHKKELKKCHLDNKTAMINFIKELEKTLESIKVVGE